MAAVVCAACGGGGGSRAQDGSTPVDAAADRSTLDSGRFDDASLAVDGKSADAAGDSGEASASVSCPPLVAMGDEITDTTTGLSWSRTAQASDTYANATAACAKWGGRLPTEAELVAFANTTYAAVVNCKGLVPQPWPADGEPLWTTTALSVNPNYVDTVHNDAFIESHPMTDGVPYICVKP